MVPGPGRTNSPPFSVVFGYNPSVSSPHRLAESEGISTSGAESWCSTESLVSNLQPLLFLPRFYHNYINTNSFGGGGRMLKWETEKAFAPSPYSETAGTPYLLIPPISWPWNGGRENSLSLTSGGSKNVSLTYIAATWCSAGYWGDCGLPCIREGWISKMDERCSHESQVGVFKKKFHSVVESTESQTVCVQRASSKHPISASKSSAQRVLFLTMPSKLILQVIRLEKSQTPAEIHITAKSTFFHQSVIHFNKRGNSPTIHQPSTNETKLQ